MKYFIRLSLVFVGIVLNVRVNNVSAKPGVHFGRCKSSRVSEGFCRSLDDCTTLDANQKKDADLLEGLKCDSDLKTLICCPKKAASLISETVTSTSPTSPTLPQPPYCGGMIVGDKIFNGEETAIDEFPWMAIIQYSGDDENSFCGGTLISARFVLTAAHCVDRKSVSGVRLGEWNMATNPDCQKSRLGNDDCAPRYVVIDAETPVIHPRYRASGNYPNDIALIPLSREVTISDWIRPICLPPAQTADTAIDDYADVTMNIAGWGRHEGSLRSSRRMLKAEVPVWARETCREFTGSNRIVLNEQQICAGNASGSCHGDSGGPLMHTKSNKRIYQIGIISMGGNCKAENRPTIYTKVDAYIKWITDEVLNKLIELVFSDAILDPFL